MQIKLLSRRTNANFICIAVVLLLTACATHGTAPGWAAPVKVPTELANPVQEPVLADKPDNGALAEFADALQAALREANRRLQVIRDL